MPMATLIMTPMPEFWGIHRLNECVVIELCCCCRRTRVRGIDPQFDHRIPPPYPYVCDVIANTLPCSPRGGIPLYIRTHSLTRAPRSRKSATAPALDSGTSTKTGVPFGATACRGQGICLSRAATCAVKDMGGQRKANLE
jgi:hypothetical protein